MGFCLTGVLVGPYGFGPIKAVHEVELLAEIGVVLLLFTIGIEFSLKRLLQIRRSILMGGSLQVGEFSFILSRTGVEHGLLAGSIYQMFLAVAMRSMAATPFIIMLAPAWRILYCGCRCPER